MRAQRPNLTQQALIFLVALARAAVSSERGDEPAFPHGFRLSDFAGDIEAGLNALKQMETEERGISRLINDVAEALREQGRLEEAAQALQDLRKEDITELRSFAKPHPLVQDVTCCVVILRGLKDVSWKGAKAMMTDGGFLRSLVEFDKDSLNDKQIKQVKTYFQQADFTPEAVKSISSAAAGLLKHMRPWEAMRPQLRNVSVAALLGAGEGESLYHSGTLGGEAAAHWQTERLLAALEGHASLASQP